jgi:DNA recombination protein RmuC
MLLVGLLVGLALGFAVAWVWSRARVAAAQARADAVAGEALASAREELVRLVTEEFRRTQELSRAHEAARLGEREQALAEAVRGLVDPVRKQLETYEEQVRRLEAGHQERQGELRQMLAELSRAHGELAQETRQLSTSLRAPAVRGRWGEQQLRRVVELAGMLEHCDFDEQVVVGAASGAASRPDLVVHLPGGREVVVDAKVPLDAFLAALDASDDAIRRDHLRRHARQLRAHVDDLCKRAYWQQLDDSVDFVIAFVPGDPLLHAAYEEDPGLFEYALANNVFLATPITLVALLRAVAYGWQQDALARNAEIVRQHGVELYERLRTLGDHLSRLGRSIDGAVDNYNRLVGSLERSVLPGARRFRDLGVVGGSTKDLVVLDELTQRTRSVSSPELVASAQGAPAAHAAPAPGDAPAPEDAPAADGESGQSERRER